MQRGGSLSSVCRTCLAPGRLQPIFPEEPGTADYSELITTYSGIQVMRDDGLPQKMCFACLHLLKSAAYFRKIARQSDEKLRSASTQYRDSLEAIKTEEIDKSPDTDSLVKFKCEDQIDHSTDHSAENFIDSSSDSSEVDKSSIEDDTSKDPEDDRKLSDLVEEKKCKKYTGTAKVTLRNNVAKRIRGTLKRETWPDFEKSIVKSEPKIINRGDKEWRTKVRAIFRISGTSAARRMECRLCGITLKQSSSMHVHAQKHLGYRVICEACGKGFPNNCALQQHCMNRHGLKKSFSCAHCPFTSAVRFELTVHERTHTGERPFVCDTCGSSFFRRRCLIVHTRSHAPTRPYKCTSCEKRFISRGDMLSHHNAVHQRRYVFPCPVCRQTYARRTTVYKHIAAQHDSSVDRKAVTKIFL